MARYDVIVVGGGHNGLVAATLLARAGRSVLVLERGADVGGAAVSRRPFAGVDARLSRYAYLVSLFPRALMADLGLDVALARRRVASFTPVGRRALRVDGHDDAATARSLEAFTGGPQAWSAWCAWHAMADRVAHRLAPTLTQPLLSAAQARARLDDDAAWEALVERPLGEAIEARLADDAVRGVVLTDALIGTLAGAHDPTLRQNRCFLYHVIGGPWDVPVGGMGALTGALERAARAAGARVRTSAEVVALDSDGRRAVVHEADGTAHDASAVVWAAAPAILERLRGAARSADAPEGSQVKVNMVLSRLPRLRDPAWDPADAFAGTLHVHEGYAELEAACAAARVGRLPDPLPCEVYCHSLTDPSILGARLRADGAHTLTLFGLHAPASLFRSDPEGAREAAVAAALRALDDVLGEPLRPCLLSDGDGALCLEAHTPVDLEVELALPGGHIFHRDLQWPWAEDDAEVGRWGVETDLPNVVLGGAGARRGGGVSGIPGHNAAQALLPRPRVRPAGPIPA